MIDCLEIDEAVMELDDRLNRLSKGQLEVLRLVDLHHNSKEIAAKLGISSHTVDQRVRGAIRLLGVSRRSEAARMVGEAGPGHEYQRLIHQAPDVDADHSISETDGAVVFRFGTLIVQGGTEASVSKPSRARSTFVPFWLCRGALDTIPATR